MWADGEVHILFGQHCDVAERILDHNFSRTQVDLLHIHLLHINNIMQPTHLIYEDVRQQTYSIYKSAYFPKFKRQPLNSATVICSFSLLKQSQLQVQVVSVGFGTKSLPESFARDHQGQVVKDMHAEILARRGFIKYLIQHLPEPSCENQIFEWVEGKKKHRLRKQYEVLMFVNEVFCGDCLVDQSSKLYSGARPLKYYKQKEMPQEKYSQHCLRTKPGRLDLPLDKRSLSLSCSDKVGVWNILGVQGKRLFNYITPIYIGAIIIETEKTVDIRRVAEGIDFIFRLKQLFPHKRNINSKLFKIVVAGHSRYITTQFHCAKPQITILARSKEETQEKTKKQELCGIISGGHVSWLNGRTGLPEGVSIHKMMNKMSPFCSQKLYENLKSNQEEEFKYAAVKERIKLLWGQWTDDYR